MVKCFKNERLLSDSQRNELTVLQNQLASPQTRAQGMIHLAEWIDSAEPEHLSIAISTNGKQWLPAIYAAMEEKCEDKGIAPHCLYCVYSIAKVLHSAKSNQEPICSLKKLLDEKCILRAAHLSLEMLSRKSTARQRAGALFLEQSLLVIPEPFAVMRNAIWDTLYDLLTISRQEPLRTACCKILALSATLGANAATRTKNWTNRYNWVIQRCAVSLNFFFSDVDIIPIPVDEGEYSGMDGSSLDVTSSTHYLQNMLLLLKAILVVPGIAVQLAIDQLVRIAIGGLQPLTKLGVRKGSLTNNHLIVESALLDLCSAVITRLGIAVCRFSDELNKTILMLLRSTEENSERAEKIFALLLVWICDRGQLAGLDRNDHIIEFVKIAIDKLSYDESRADGSAMKFLIKLVDVYLDQLPNQCLEDLRQFCFQVSRLNDMQSPLRRAIWPLMERVALFPTKDGVSCLEAIVGMKRVYGCASSESSCETLLFRAVQPLLPVASGVDVNKSPLDCETVAVSDGSESEHITTSPDNFTLMESTQETADMAFQCAQRKKSESTDSSVDDNSCVDDTSLSTSSDDPFCPVEVSDASDDNAAKRDSTAGNAIAATEVDAPAVTRSDNPIINECLHAECREADMAADELTVEEVVRNFHPD